MSGDGTVYTNSVWDEGGREAGIYKDGDAVGNPGFTHGNGNMGGRAVAINKTYLYIAAGMGNENGHLVDPNTYPPSGHTWFGISRRPILNVSGPAPFPGGKGGALGTLPGSFLVINDVPADVDAGITGLAADNQHLYVSNPSTNQILIYDAVTMAQLGAFPFPNPGKLVLDRAGTLWIVKTGSPSAILHYSSTGVALPERITDVVDPEALAIDNQGRLMVGEAGPALQIRFYSISGTPMLMSSFGTLGGVYSGKPGQISDLKLGPASGAGTDSQGNIYVAANLVASDIRKFSPRGEILWRLVGLTSVDAAVVDPASGGADVYTRAQHFTMDYSQPPGREWSWTGTTVHPFLYPNDPRTAPPVSSRGLSSLGVRNLFGNKYLFLTDQYSSTLQIYRLEGEIAVPSGFFANAAIPGWLPGIQPASGRWIWRDLNGDGDFQAHEFLEADGVSDFAVWGWDVDSAGNIWQVSESSEGVRQYSLQGIDRARNLIYSRAKSTVYGVPKPFNRLERAKYNAETDSMFLSGYTVDRPHDPAEPGFGAAGTEIVRYNNWSAGNLAPAFRIPLPYDPAGRRMVKAVTVEGNLIVAGMFAMTPLEFLYLYDATTGASLGQIYPGAEVNTISGLIDGTQLLQAYQRGDEYLIFVEEVTWGKILMYRTRISSPFLYHAPTADLVAPSTGVGKSQTFSFTFSDADGVADMTDVEVLFNTKLSGAHGCHIIYQPAQQLLSLGDDSGTRSAGSIPFGGADSNSGVLQNNQCSLDASASAVAVSGNSLVLKLGLTFGLAGSGSQNIYALANDAEGLTSGFQILGTWTGIMQQPPAIVSVKPNSGGGASQLFSFVYSDVRGAANLNRVGAAFSGGANGATCFLYYDQMANALLLLADDGLNFSAPLTPGGSGTVQNSQCRVDAPSSSVTTSDYTLTLNVSLNFFPAFAGASNILSFAYNNDGLSTTQKVGSWLVPVQP